jgi:hypothetical protein
MFFRESYLAQALKYCDSMYACISAVVPVFPLYWH